MAEQVEKQDLDSFQLWTVSPQENVKTIIIQQPAETHMNLDASTDKTAIGSFGLSVIVALILGGLATWLAYWYGKKSFKLTEMSFKAVSQDIKETAETNRNTTLSLIQSQEHLKNKELREVFKNKWFDDVLRSLIEASNLLEVWITNARSINLLLMKNIIDDPNYKIFEDKYCAEELKKLQDERREITFNLKKLRILLNLDEQTNDPQFIKRLLDIQINVNKISKALVQFEDCDAICRQLYLENVDISDLIGNILKLKML